MSQAESIGPLSVSVGPTEVRLWFADPDDSLLELPAGLEAELSAFAGDCGGDLLGKSVVIDLQGTAFVSSRQLGVMLTVRKVLSSDSPVSLVNVSSGLSRILVVTGLDRHFIVTDADPVETNPKAASRGSAK